MKETGVRNGAHGAEKFGLKDLAAIHWNLSDTILVEHAIADGEGQLVQGGAFCAETGAHTGRSPKDKFVVADALARKNFNCCSTISLRMPKARLSTPRISTAAPTRNTASKSASTTSSPGIRCSSVRC